MYVANTRDSFYEKYGLDPYCPVSGLIYEASIGTEAAKSDIGVGWNMGG